MGQAGLSGTMRRSETGLRPEETDGPNAVVRGGRNAKIQQHCLGPTILDNFYNSPIFESGIAYRSTILDNFCGEGRRGIQCSPFERGVTSVWNLTKSTKTREFHSIAEPLETVRHAKKEKFFSFRIQHRNPLPHHPRPRRLRPSRERKAARRRCPSFSRRVDRYTPSFH